MLIKATRRPKVDVPLYEGNLNMEELMDWISSLDKYFEFEEVEDKRKVKFAATRLKGSCNYLVGGVTSIRKEKRKAQNQVMGQNG